jgi:uncharacterized protein
MKNNLHKLLLVAFATVGLGQLTQASKPIRALLVTGGCFHDYYYTQSKVLTDSINKYLYNVQWDIVAGTQTTDGQISVLGTKDWSKGYDVVIYNICYADVMDTAYINNICRNHQNGVNAIVIHCTMHTFRDAGDEEWKKLLGIDSHDHAASGIFRVTNVNANHPVMKDFPAHWITPVDEELYMVKRQFPSVTPLATGTGDDKKEYTCMWANTYGKSRIVGSSIGHATETLQNHDYILFLSRSILWLTNNIDEKGEPSANYWKLAKNYRSGKLYKHNELVIDNFENYNNTNDFTQTWAKAGWGNEISATIENTPEADGKNAMKVAYKTGNDAFSGYALVIGNKKIDMSGYNALQFWFKPDGSGRQLEVQLNAANEKGENYGDYWEALVKTNVGDNTPRIVTIPFSDFKRPASVNLVDKELSFNTASVCQIILTIRNKNENPGSGVFYFDDFKAITQIKLPVVIDNFDNYATDSQVKRAWYIPGHGGVVKQSLENGIKGGGKYSLKCEYNVTKSKDKFYAPICRVDKWDLTGTDAVQFWFKPDGSGREFLFELNIANSKGNNIHDLWDFMVYPKQGDTIAQIITVPYSKLVHNTKHADAPDLSPVFLPGAVIEVAICIGGRNGKPGNGTYYFDEFKAIKQ